MSKIKKMTKDQAKQAALDGHIASLAKSGCLAVRAANRIESELDQGPPSLTMTLPRHVLSAMTLVIEAATGSDFSQLTLTHALRYQAIAEKQRLELEEETKGGGMAC